MTKRLHMVPARSGFTIVELLVVVAIILVLAALLFSVTKSMQSAGQQATCINNQRQIGHGLTNYTSDNGHFPGRADGICWDRAAIEYLGYDGERSLSGNGRLPEADWRELQHLAKLFACPADHKERNPAYFKRSYAIVPWTTNHESAGTFRGWRNRTYNAGVPLTAVPNAASAALVVEWHTGEESIPNYLGSGAHAFHDVPGPFGETDKIHGKRSVVLFVDGHTEALPLGMPQSEFREKYWPGTIGSSN